MKTDILDSLLQHCELMPEKWLELASGFGPSDIHLTPRKNCYELGIRINSKLHKSNLLDPSQGKKLIQRLKSAAKVNIAESRNPQDGRIQCNKLEARIATHPCIDGEGLSIRLFALKKGLSLFQLGLPKHELKKIIDMVTKAEGLTLISGPTGSGKTTLVHAALEHLGDAAGRIVTLEDPVEIVNENALQTDLSRLPDLSFAKGLRSLMRQDPDTLLVGEVRDAETASLCLNAALTGHRVLATVHAPSPSGTISRMQELGVPLNALLNTLNGVINLRLKPSVHTNELKPIVQTASFIGIPQEKLLDCSSLADLSALIKTNEGFQHNA